MSSPLPVPCASTSYRFAGRCWKASIAIQRELKALRIALGGMVWIEENLSRVKSKSNGCADNTLAVPRRRRIELGMERRRIQSSEERIRRHAERIGSAVLNYAEAGINEIVRQGKASRSKGNHSHPGSPVRNTRGTRRK
jgi:hypothetical protein